jgi:hypothetical protein
VRRNFAAIVTDLLLLQPHVELLLQVDHVEARGWGGGHVLPPQLALFFPFFGREDGVEDFFGFSARVGQDRGGFGPGVGVIGFFLQSQSQQGSLRGRTHLGGGRGFLFFMLGHQNGVVVFN